MATSAFFLIRRVSQSETHLNHFQTYGYTYLRARIAEEIVRAYERYGDFVSSSS
jgi:hypothetical protein